MSQDNSPKVILITGCSSGFGLLMAARFAEYGEQIIATVRSEDKKVPLKNEALERETEIDIQYLDVTDKKMTSELMKHITKEYGYIDVLINNAGYGIGGAFEDLTDEEFREQMEVNFFGVLNMTRAALPFMRRRPQARIINISSISGFSSVPCLSAYNASKWALEGWSESLRYELKPLGIDVCLVRPGSYKTKVFYENRRYAKNFNNEHSPYYEMSQTLDKNLNDQLEDNHKDPEEVVDLVAKLIYRRNPPFRSIPDLEGNILYFLRRVLPFRIYSAIIAAAFLPRKNDEG